MFQNGVKLISQILILGDDYVVNRQRLCQRIKLWSVEFRSISSVLGLFHMDKYREFTFSYIIVGVDLFLLGMPEIALILFVFHRDQLSSFLLPIYFPFSSHSWAVEVIYSEKKSVTS